MSKKILLFSRDPGGANTIFPLVETLKEKKYDVKLYGKDVALSKYKQHGIEGINVLNKVNSITMDEIINFLIKESPDFIITGTSANDFTEKYIWKAAEKLKIPNFAILDQWVNYGIRFSQFNVSELEKYNKKKEQPYLPTKILVMDEYAKNQIIKEGIDRNKIVVAGQPYFDYLIDKCNKISNDDIKKCRQDFQCDDNEFLITYASEPISKVYKESDNSKHYWGYTEKTILKDIIHVIKNIKKDTKKNIKIIIRPHPKEEEDNYLDIIKNIKYEGISIIVDKKYNPYILMKASNLIIGMSSMFLIESVVLRNPIISVQIGLKRQNPFILEHKKIIKSILQRKELEKKLREFIICNKLDISFLDLEYGSVNNVIKYMEEVLWQS